MGEPEGPHSGRALATSPAALPAGVLEQYQLAVEMADRVSARRATANSFFLTVQTTLLALMAVKGIHRDWVAGAGVVLAVAWWLLLRSYRDLSAAKWKVIQAVEAQLPLQPFSDEWSYLKQDPVAPLRSRYAELGLVERLVPAVFAAIFVVVILFA